MPQELMGSAAPNSLDGPTAMKFLPVYLQTDESIKDGKMHHKSCMQKSTETFVLEELSNNCLTLKPVVGV
eukprot:14578141-Ditylum_brightwellii.AAC.1